jgi:hypothetical protein
VIRSTIEIETDFELSDDSLEELARLVRGHLCDGLTGTIHGNKPLHVRAVCSCGHVMTP